MDIHIVGAEPTAEERAAVDALLGPPDSGWEGGARDAARDGRTARGGRPAAVEQRHLLLPALHAVQDRVGWVSRGALNYICRRLIVPPAEAWGVAHLLSPVRDRAAAAGRRPRLRRHRLPRARRRGAVRGAGAADGAGRRRPGAATWMRSPCLGQCDRAPAVLVVRAGATATRAVLAPVGDAAAVQASCASTAGTADTLDDLRRLVPQSGDPGSRCCGASASSIRRASTPTARPAATRALARAIEMGPEAIIAEVQAAKLLGRGGAAFPTGKQVGGGGRASRRGRTSWSATPTSPSRAPSRIACCSKSDPFAIVEAMTICGIATGCEQRLHLHPRRVSRSRERRVAAARSTRRAPPGCSATTSLGSGIRFDIEMRRGAGAYICGEETALFNSLEGKRGEPRSKPPFPGAGRRSSASRPSSTTSRRWSTCSTSCSRAARRGRRPAPPASTGTRLFCLSGHVARPGPVRVAVRPARLREVIDAGRRRGGRTAAAGGAARRRRRHVRRARGARRAADLRRRARGRRARSGPAW